MIYFKQVYPLKPWYNVNSEIFISHCQKYFPQCQLIVTLKYCSDSRGNITIANKMTQAGIQKSCIIDTEEG